MSTKGTMLRTGKTIKLQIYLEIGNIMIDNCRNRIGWALNLHVSGVATVLLMEEIIAM